MGRPSDVRHHRSVGTPVTIVGINGLRCKVFGNVLRRHYLSCKQILGKISPHGTCIMQEVTILCKSGKRRGSRISVVQRNRFLRQT